jgi:hypothetical protein
MHEIARVVRVWGDEGEPRPSPSPFGDGCLLVGGSLLGKSVSSSGAVRFGGGVGEVYEFC